MKTENFASPEMLPVLYFGCIGAGRGHNLFKSENGHPRYQHFYSTPWGRDIDTGLCPKPEPKQPDGVLCYRVKDGWSAIAFWDRSGDQRPGSNTVFLVNAFVPALELLELARRQWPDVFKRENFPLNNRLGQPLPIIMPGEQPYA